MEKPCRQCGETKSLDQFPRHKEMSDRHLNKCKSCTNAYMREYSQRPYALVKRRDAIERWKAENREAYLAQQNQAEKDRRKRRAEAGLQRAYDRKVNLRRFGLTPEGFADLFQSQGGVCAICGQPETAMVKGVVKELSIDHHHETGKVRGLLCANCNNGLGRFKDNPTWLRRAADYLER